MALGLAALAQSPALCQYRTNEHTPITDQPPGVAAGGDIQAP